MICNSIKLYMSFNNIDLFSRIQIENENRSMETVDTGALQNEIEKVMVWSIFAELFDFWLKIQNLIWLTFYGWGTLTSG